MDHCSAAGLRWAPRPKRHQGRAVAWAVALVGHAAAGLRQLRPAAGPGGAFAAHTVPCRAPQRRGFGRPAGEPRPAPRPQAVQRAAWAVTAPPFNGIWEAVSAIFVSELGDKTFFLTMVLSFRRGRALALVASQSALWTMTAVSCTIGVVLRSFPSNRAQGAVNLAAALLMLLFGFQSLREAQWAGPAKTEEATLDHEECNELNQAECEIDEQLAKAKAATNPLLDFLRFAVLIFLAEWGDRSMFVTVTLAASRSPFGVFLGGCAGHLAAASLAVLCGGILQKYISDKLIRTVGGLLFIAFGVTTLLGIY